MFSKKIATLKENFLHSGYIFIVVILYVMAPGAKFPICFIFLVDFGSILDIDYKKYCLQNFEKKKSIKHFCLRMISG